MKVKDIPSLEQKVLDMLPITQAEVWKSLGIGHRDGSTLVGIMLGENLIRKTRFKGTFMLERKNGEKNGKTESKKEYSPLLNKDGKFSPCVGCKKECDPGNCETLAQWLK